MPYVNARTNISCIITLRDKEIRCIPDARLNWNERFMVFFDNKELLWNILQCQWSRWMHSEQKLLDITVSKYNIIRLLNNVINACMNLHVVVLCSIHILIILNKLNIFTKYSKHCFIALITLSWGIGGACSRTSLIFLFICYLHDSVTGEIIH